MLILTSSIRLASQSFDSLYAQLYEASLHGDNDTSVAHLHAILAEETLGTALYDLSLEHALQVLKLETSDATKVNAYNLIGLSHSYVKEYELAVSALLKGHQIIEASEEQILNPSLYHNLAETYGFLDSTDLMMYYFDKSIEIRKEIGGDEFNYMLIFDEAVKNFYKKDNIAALEVFSSLSTKYKEEVPLTYRAKVYGYMSLIHKRSKDFKLCLGTAQEQLKYAVLSDFHPERIYAYKFLADCNEGMGSFEDALHYRSKYFSLKDSIQKNNSQTRLAALRSNQDYMNKIKESDFLRKENELQKTILKQERSWRYWLLGLLLAAGVVICASFYIASLRKERSELNLAMKAKAEEALSEKTILLKEIHHRVKNNLQSLSGLFYLQQQTLTDSSKVALLKSAQDRLTAISLLQDDLYQPDASHLIIFKNYLKLLVENVKQSYDFTEQPLELVISCENFKVDLDTAVPMALICNELITNSVKHATPVEGHLKIRITCIRTENGLQITHKDNGTIPIEVGEVRSSFGSYLINSLLKKFSGSMNYLFDNGGTFVIDLPRIEIL